MPISLMPDKQKDQENKRHKKSCSCNDFYQQDPLLKLHSLGPKQHVFVIWLLS